MAAGPDFLYVGTGSGFILSLATETLELCSVLPAYTHPVRQLLLVAMLPPMRFFSRLFSCKPGAGSGRSSVASMLSWRHQSRAGYSELSDGSEVGSRRGSLEDSASLESRTVLVSFGQGYRTITADSKCEPPNFICPCDTGGCASGCLCSSVRPAKAAPTDTYLLLWSTEAPPLGVPGEIGEGVVEEKIDGER